MTDDITYKIIGSFDCNGTNVFSWVKTPYCDGPLTLTLEPLPNNCAEPAEPCCDCETYASAYTFTISTEDGNCENCANFNGTYDMAYVGKVDGKCTWRFESPIVVCGMEATRFCNLECNGTVWMLTMGCVEPLPSGETTIVWHSCESFICMGDSEFGIYDQTGDCSGWPTLLTVSPT